MLKKSLIYTGIMAAIAGNAYATGENIITSKNYVDTTVAAKQPTLTAHDGDYAVLYPGDGDADGEVGERVIINYIGDADHEGELITAGAVATALNAKQDAIEGSNALNGKVITYSGTTGETGTKDVYNSSAQYNTQTNALVMANQVNGAITGGLNQLVTCAEYSTANDPTSGCILYQINTVSNVF